MSSGNVSQSGGPTGKGGAGRESKSIENTSAEKTAKPEDAEKMKDAFKEKPQVTEKKGSGVLTHKDSPVKKALTEGATREGLLGKEGPLGKEAAVVQPLGQGGPLGQVAPVEGAKAPAGAAKSEMADLATSMIDKMHSNVKTGEITMKLTGDSNPNLKGVDVSITKNPETGALDVKFTASTAESQNYISQNLAGLKDQLKADTNFKDINIDVTTKDTDSESGQDRRSKGEYYDEESDK